MSTQTNGYESWWKEYEARQIASFRSAAAAVGKLAEYPTSGQRGHFLETSGAPLIGRPARVHLRAVPDEEPDWRQGSGETCDELAGE